jgi:hypothetical protein
MSTFEWSEQAAFESTNIPACRYPIAATSPWSTVEPAYCYSNQSTISATVLEANYDTISIPDFNSDITSQHTTIDKPFFSTITRTNYPTII